MQRHDAERLIVSIIIAAVLFTAAGAVLAIVGIPETELPEYSGPVFITIEEDPLLLTDLEIEPIPEEPPPEPVRAEPETVPESAAETRSAVDRETPAAREREAPQPLPRERNTDTRPQPNTADEPEPDTAASAEGEPAEVPEEPSEAPEQAEEYETAGVETGPAETEPLSTGDTETTASPEEPEESEPEVIEEPGVLGDSGLARLDEALADAGSRGTQNGTADGSGTANGRSDSVSTLGTADNPIDFDTLEGRRKLLYGPEPDINDELARNLPPQFDVVISFTLESSGIVSGLNISTDSGNTEVDSIIERTIRSWKFEPAPDSGPIQVRVRYNIRVR